MASKVRYHSSLTNFKSCSSLNAKLVLKHTKRRRTDEVWELEPFKEAFVRHLDLRRPPKHSWWPSLSSEFSYSYVHNKERTLFHAKITGWWCHFKLMVKAWWKEKQIFIWITLLSCAWYFCEGFPMLFQSSLNIVVDITLLT